MPMLISQIPTAETGLSPEILNKLGSWGPVLAAIYERLRADPTGGMSVGMVKMPGGIAPKYDILQNLRDLQGRQGRHPGMYVPDKAGLTTTQRLATAPPVNATDLAKEPLLKNALQTDTIRPGGPPTQYQPAGPQGSWYDWAPAHDKEALWDKMLEYFIGTSRQ